LEDWKTAGKTLVIFSSGSVQAQLQFFSYVREGQSTKDIKHLFSAHYDTLNAGPKLEKASYEKICRELGVDVSKVTFLTDNVKGMFARSCLLETPVPAQHPYTLLHSHSPPYNPLIRIPIHSSSTPKVSKIAAISSETPAIPNLSLNH
jgi:hypothetical protein